MRRMQNLEYIFVCTPFFRPRSFELSRLLTLAFDIWEYAAIAYILVGFLYELLQGKLKQRKIHAVVYLLAALKIWEVISAALNGALYFAKVEECVGTIALALYTDAVMQKTRTQIVKYLSVLTGILLFINNLSYLYMGSSDYTDATEILSSSGRRAIIFPVWFFLRWSPHIYCSIRMCEERGGSIYGEHSYS